MSNIEKSLAHLERALKLTNELQEIVKRSERRKRIVGILIGVVLSFAVLLIAKFY